ncbi:MAG: hypothetical protein JSR60_08205 [Proteobacteria bacterium]|nr:hypothetical protein [Pseudomonadota bacterium]
MFSYNISSLVVDCEIELPGRLAATSNRPAEITIRSAIVPEALDAPIAVAPTWEMTRDQFLLRVPGVARFLVVGDDTILFDAAATATPADLAIFLAGSVFGVLLHLRGYVVLHASAVRVGACAILFCGASGAGKSTIAAALANRGYPVVTDDICAVTIDPVPIVHPDGRQLKLWREAIDALAMSDKAREAVRPSIRKYYVEPPAADRTPMPIGAIYALREPRPPAVIGIQQLPPAVAAAKLHENAYRPRLVDRLGQAGLYFAAATRIASDAGVYHLTRRRDFASMEQVLRSLERHWDAIGLGGRPA